VDRPPRVDEPRPPLTLPDLSPEARRKRALRLQDRFDEHIGPEGQLWQSKAFRVITRVWAGAWHDGFIHAGNLAYMAIIAIFPFFILGEVQAPGQYPYVPNMTVESAVAIAGGFSPRARRDQVTLTHTDASGTARFVVTPGSAVAPGDTVLVGERWF